MALADNPTDNQSAYRRIKPEIDDRFPPGRFVAIHRGAIVADAPEFDALAAAVDALGIDLRDSLVVQAGVDYPTSAVIFAGLVEKPE
jgi:hypothetical protein